MMKLLDHVIFCNFMLVVVVKCSIWKKNLLCISYVTLCKLSILLLSIKFNITNINYVHFTFLTAQNMLEIRVESEQFTLKNTNWTFFRGKLIVYKCPNLFLVDWLLKDKRLDGIQISFILCSNTSISMKGKVLILWYLFSKHFFNHRNT